LHDSSSVSGNTSNADDEGGGRGGGIINVCDGTLNNAIDGDNVNDNHRGTAAPVEDNIYEDLC
jgi:hypothetical protein